MANQVRIKDTIAKDLSKKYSNLKHLSLADWVNIELSKSLTEDLKTQSQSEPRKGPNFIELSLHSFSNSLEIGS